MAPTLRSTPRRSPLVRSMMRKAWRAQWSPPAAPEAPDVKMACKIKAELRAGKTVKNVPLTASTARERVSLLKAYSHVVAPRFRPEQLRAVAQGEKLVRALLRDGIQRWEEEQAEQQAKPEEQLPAPGADPVFEAIRDQPATSWTEAQVSEWLGRRTSMGDVRPARFDPVCELITHYKRVGRKARYAFKCYLRSHKGTRRSPQAAFWVPYLDVRARPSAEQLLSRSGWVMSQHFNEYSQGETAWERHPPSWDEGIQERRLLRGSEHRLVKQRAKRRRQ